MSAFNVKLISWDTGNQILIHGNIKLGCNDILIPVKVHVMWLYDS